MPEVTSLLEYPGNQWPMVSHLGDLAPSVKPCRDKDGTTVLSQD